MATMHLDPDLVVVHRAVEHSAAAAAALNRLIAKSGSAYLQRDLLLCTAETLMSVLGKREREAEEDTTVFDLERYFAMHDGASEPDKPDQSKQEPDKPDQSKQEPSKPEPSKPEPSKPEPSKQEPEPLKKSKTSVDDMRTFLAKPTKLKNTLRQFFQRYGCGECRRQDLIELLMTCEDVVHHTGVGKLFHPPKGFLQAVFEKTEAGAVRAARQWLFAADLAADIASAAPAAAPAADIASHPASDPASADLASDLAPADHAKAP